MNNKSYFEKRYSDIFSNLRYEMAGWGFEFLILNKLFSLSICNILKRTKLRQYIIYYYYFSSYSDRFYFLYFQILFVSRCFNWL